jgi:hypothetical protein
MPLYSVTDVASVGLVVDLDPVLLPPGAWTEVKNVRFANGAAEKMFGEVSVATPEIEPQYVIPVVKGTAAYWVYAGLEKVYTWNGTAHSNITPNDGATPPEDVDFTGSATDLWNGTIIQGVLVLNNGVDAPHMWVDSVLTPLQWDSGDDWATKGYTAKVIRAYKDYLVALNWDDGTDSYPHSVYWSNAADPLSVPSDWDYADPANESGIATLASSQGYIVDGEQLRDAFVVYKEDAIVLMQLVDGAWVMNFRDVSKTTGVLSQRCAKEVYGKHAVLCSDDIIVHDGQNIESIANKRVRRNIFSSIDPTYFTRSYVARALSRQELWFCYPETGQTVPNMAAVWHWRDNTWTFREIPSVPHIGFGVLPSTVDADDWDSDGAAWDTDTSAWDERTYNPATQSLVGAGTDDLWHMDTGTLFGASEITSYVLRDGILLDGQPTLKTVLTVYPRMTGDAVQVSIGAKFDVHDAYVWEGPYTFTPSTDSKVRCRVTGRFHAIKFQFAAAGESRLHGYDMAYEVVGSR